MQGNEASELRRVGQMHQNEALLVHFLLSGMFVKEACGFLHFNSFHVLVFAANRYHPKLSMWGDGDALGNDLEVFVTCLHGESVCSSDLFYCCPLQLHIHIFFACLRINRAKKRHKRLDPWPQ